MNLDLYLTPYTEINLRYIIGLNLKAKIIKLLEEHVREYFHDLEVGQKKNVFGRIQRTLQEKKLIK